MLFRSQPYQRTPFAAAATLVAVCLAHPSANAAKVDKADLAQLNATAKQSGYVAVLVHLGEVSLQAIKSGGAAFVRAQMQVRQSTLLTELGATALQGGVWNNGLGQIGVYVTPAGLQKLQSSSNAVSFSPDTTRSMRATASDRSGALSAIESALRDVDLVGVEVIYDIPSVFYELDTQGRTFARGTAAFEADALSRMNESFDRHPALRNANTGESIRAKILARFGALAQSLSTEGAVAVPMQVDRAAFYSLREQPGVIAIRPAGFKDTRVTKVDPEALDAAHTTGSATVEIVLKGSEAFNHAGGHMTQTGWATQKRIHEAAISDIVSTWAGKLVRNHGQVGGGFVTLTEAALRNLAKSGDPRIAAVNLLRGAAVPALSTATGTFIMNMPNAWAANYRGAGQYVAFLDNGIRKQHVMLQDATGQSRVVLEGCFGTNGIVSQGLLSGTYESPCPSQNASGDSPPGTLNAGDPSPESWGGYFNGSHGTYVAAAAIGRASASTGYGPTFQGVAPDAYGVSVNVFSKIAGSTTTTALPQDIADGLAYLYSFTRPGVVIGATINMSFASPELYTSNCDNVNSIITSHVQNFLSRGIPVVAATGNSGSHTSISWPACIQNVMKVATVNNSATTLNLALVPNTNYADPANFTGTFYVGPGGTPGRSNWVYSAGAYLTFPSSSDYSDTLGAGDSSVSAAFVSGYYAVVKAALPDWSVADITAWIVASGSQPRFSSGFGGWKYYLPRSPV